MCGPVVGMPTGFIEFSNTCWPHEPCYQGSLWTMLAVLCFILLSFASTHLGKFLPFSLLRDASTHLVIFWSFSILLGFEMAHRQLHEYPNANELDRPHSKQCNTVWSVLLFICIYCRKSKCKNAHGAVIKWNIFRATVPLWGESTCSWKAFPVYDKAFPREVILIYGNGTL